ncbi:MAG: polysaccharide deacetylase family protein [Proteobacteria bacterium]|nr:polysaccharide deacetylase family protein [Pseudomonadota bacterium]
MRPVAASPLIYRSMKDRVPLEIRKHLGEVLDRGRENAKETRLYFRADDMGVPGKKAFLLMEMFKANGVPLNLALVPAWLTQQRWEAIRPFARKAGSLFSWHQHGWRHVNHESVGKKQEFGLSRKIQDIKRELIQGTHRLTSLVGKRYCPVFTPPWNRCDKRTLALVAALGFYAVSRDFGCIPPSPAGLRDFPVHVDLHTRKDESPARGWEGLFNDLAAGLESGQCGIMVHHARMDGPAFVFLEYLIEEIQKNSWIIPVTFDQLIGNG